GIGDGICRRNERQIGNDHLIAGTQSERGEGEVKAGGAIAHRQGVFGSAVAREIRLELVDVFSDRGYPSRVQRFQYEFLLARSNQRLRNRNEGVGHHRLYVWSAG